LVGFLEADPALDAFLPVPLVGNRTVGLEEGLPCEVEFSKIREN
jgi:hypothetical protein